MNIHTNKNNKKLSASSEFGGSQDIFYAKSNAVPLPIIERASGIYMWDEEGNEYIDTSSGPVVSNIGHGNVRVAEAMAEQAKRMDFAYSRISRHRPNMELSDHITRLAGPGFERVCLASGGSEAMEIGIKFLRQYAVATGNGNRRKIITCMPSYHGGTIALLGISGDDALAPFLDGFAPANDKIPAPLTYRIPENHTVESYAQACADALEVKIQELGPENVLAFVLEPIGGLATGCSVPPAEYFRNIRRICDRHGIYLVFDEILCGTGRTGRFLAAHHWPDSLPDIVVMAKGLGSGYTPLAAMLASARMVDELSELTGFSFSHTYNANPISCAVGVAVLDEYERLNLVHCAEVRGKYLRKRLREIAERVPIVGDIRGMGLVMAMELVGDKESKTMLPEGTLPTERVRTHGLRNGLLIYSRRVANGKYGDWFMVSPPMTITQDECDELARRLEQTLVDYYEELKASGTVK